jgi:hypothetical protein
VRNDIMVVGSVPLDNAEQVFRAVGIAFGDRIRAIPDGETGARLNWIEWQAPIFEAHPLFQSAESLPDWRNKDATAKWKASPWYSLRPDADAATLAFGPLGYAKNAVESFAVFARCKTDGAVAPSCKFQIAIPTPYNVIDQRIAPADRLTVEAPYEARMRQEIAELCAALPHDEIAIQWDVAHEVQNLAGGRPHWFDDPENQIVERLLRIGNCVPASVDLGFHLCYGDFAHRHFVEPKDTGLMVRLTNALAHNLNRSIAWIHMPVPRGRMDDAYFAPLSGLRLAPDTRLFLGLVHFTDGVNGARNRIKAAKNFVQNFGIATECGFGRRDPKTIPDLLRLHVDVANLLA